MPVCVPKCKYFQNSLIKYFTYIMYSAMAQLCNQIFSNLKTVQITFEGNKNRRNCV